MKLKDLITRFMVEMNGTETQVGVKPLMASHSYCLLRLQRAPIADKDAPKLQKFDVIEHVKGRRKTVGPATALHDITFLRGVLKYAGSAWDDCSDVSDACIAAAMPMLVKHGLIGKSAPRKRRPTAGELDQLVEFLTAQDARSHIKVVPCLMFALASTRRRGEICRMHRGGIDWEKRTYMIRDMKHPTKKKGNNKSFPLTDDLAEIIKLQPRLTDSPEERVFPYNDKSLGARYTLAKKALGIVDLRFHDNRREAISRWLARGLPPHKVRQISGHENTIILERVYDAPKAEDLHGDIARLAA